MARIVFISPYLKGGRDATHLAYRTRYFATREGVELLPGENGTLPATKKQEDFIARLTHSFPSSAELLEYAEYQSTPNRRNASEFISQAWEQFIEPLDRMENYLDYVARRPGVQALGEHGLWNADGKVPVLSQVIDEVANHSGNVWTPVVSLPREEAERLGYDNAENWQALINSCACDIAEGYKIHPDHLRWYAAFHEKEKHVHVHMLVFSADPKEGYLTKQGIRDIKSAFAQQIFRQDLISVYEKQTQYRDALGRNAESLMSELISKMENGTIQNDKLEQLTAELIEKLRHTSGKKVYGYLPPKVKALVDQIVDELAADERVAKAYTLWQEMRDEVCRTYSENLGAHLPLSKQKEFKPVRNMVIREALKLSDVYLNAVKRDELEPENIRTPALTKKINPETADPPDTKAEPIILGESQAFVPYSFAPKNTDFNSLSVGSTVLWMLHNMGQIFRETSTSDNVYKGMQLDKKRRRKLQQKKMAMGHKYDDHEDRPTQAMR